MYAEERQHEIVRIAREQGRADVTTLAAALNVTAETIRRDLTTLERAGVLRRVHGGAIPVERIGFEPALAIRDSVFTEEKERIAKAAIAEVPDEGSIILDAGTTTGRLAQALPPDKELTVVVNSPVIAAALGTRKNLNILLLGGRLRGRTLATVDDWALRPLADMYVDVAFMGTNGISVERGLTTPDPAEAAVKQAMIRAARRCVVLADHTKLGSDCLARFGGLSDVDTFITDSGGPDEDLLLDIEAHDVRVVRA
jgi:DeoR family transcriptional regulator, fructose operon transcriptional repressor